MMDFSVGCFFDRIVWLHPIVVEFLRFFLKDSGTLHYQDFQLLIYALFLYPLFCNKEDGFKPPAVNLVNKITAQVNIRLVKV